MGGLVESGRLDLGGEGPGGVAIDWVAARRTKKAGGVCGDGFYIGLKGGKLLAALLDGAGSGAAAAQATEAGLGFLRATQSCEIATLFAATHEACLGTRGVAMAAAVIAPQPASEPETVWAAVGDIAGFIAPRGGQVRRANAALLPRGGVLGYRLPKVSESRHALGEDAFILLASDGLRSPSEAGFWPNDATPEAMTAMMTALARDNDDASAIMLRIAPPC